MYRVYTQLSCLQSRDMMKNLVVTDLFGIVVLMRLKNAWPYLGLIKVTAVVVVFDYPGSILSHGMGVRSSIQRILNIES